MTYTDGGTDYVGRTRLQGMIIANDNVGAGSVVFYDNTAATGTPLLTIDVPQGDVMNIGLPDAGVVFETGIYVDLTNISRVTLFVQ
jgi:hypothetical protein